MGSVTPTNLPPPPLPPPPAPQAPRWGLGDVALGLVLYFVVQLFLGALVIGALSGLGVPVNLDASGPPSGLVLAILLPLSWIPLVAWPWWVSRHKGTASMSRDFGLAIKPTDVLVGLGGGLVALALSVVLAVVFTAVTGEPPQTNTDIVSGVDTTMLWLLGMLGLIAVGTPIAEEIFFRGLVLGAARNTWGLPGGIAFSSLLFGLVHIQDTLAGWAYVGTVTGLFGVVFALTRVWTDGRIGAAIVAHMVVNAVAVVVVFST